jgi:uncharacterized protein (TIGR03437 family)
VSAAVLVRIPYLEEIMTIKPVSRFIVLLVVCLAATASAQQVLVLPGAASTANTFSVFTPQPFAAVRTIQADAGAFLAFINPAGTRYYVVTPSKLIVTQTDGTQVQSIPIGQTVNGAALAPDGSRLVVAAGTAAEGSVTVFDVSGDGATQVASFTSISYPLDVAIGMNSATAYVVNTTGITPVDLGDNTAGTLVPLSGLAPQGTSRPGVSVGPSGLLYVNASNALYELNPATLDTIGTIAVVGFPGKPGFRSNATAAVAANQNYYSATTKESRLWIFDLAAHTITTQMVNSSKQFSQAFYASDDKIYATEPTIGRVASFPPTFTGNPTYFAAGAVSAALSSEPNAPKYFFVATSGQLVRYTIADDSTSTSQTLSTGPGPTFYAQPAITGSAATFSTFNATQRLVRGATALPLVARVLNADGLPLAGIKVKWTAATSVTLTDAMTTTNVQGYAVATATAPLTDGTYPVYVAFPNSGLGGGTTFTLTVAAAGGGGVPTTAEGLSMVAGNGQLMMGGDPAISPLEVLATDSTGLPSSGAIVTFTIGADQGTLATATGTSSCVSTSGGRVLTCTTDSNGHASVLFQAPPLSPGAATKVSTITASTTAGSSTATKSVAFIENTMPVAQIDGTVNPLPVMTITAPTAAAGTRTLTGAAGTTIAGAFKAQLTAPALANVGLSVRTTAAYVADAPSPATCSGAGGTALSNASGLATCNLVLGSQEGSYLIYAVLGERAASSYTLIITKAPVATPVATTVVLTTGEGTGGSVGDTVTLVGTVKDQNGAIMSGQAVTWAVVAGTATITSKSTSTTTTGQATAKVKIGAVGAIQVKLTAGTVSNIFHVTGTQSVSTFTIESGDNQSAVVSTGFEDPLVVKVMSASGPMVSYPVTFAATSGVTLSATSATTDSNGLASVTATAGSGTGKAQVTATAGTQTRTFNLTIRTAGPVLDKQKSFLNGASFAENYVSFGAIATIKTEGLTAGLELKAGSCLTDGTIDGLPVTGGLPTRIAGVEFQFGSVLAPIFAICKNADGTEQANVQVPFNVPPGPTWAIVRYGADTSSPTTFGIPDLQVLNSAPGIFEYSVSDTALGAVAVRPDGSVISPTNGAKAGETIEVYVTGMGPAIPMPKTNAPGLGQKMYFTPTVKLGDNDLASVTGVYARNGIGLYIVTFQVPSTQTASASVPLVVGVIKNDKTTAVSQTSHIAIQ